MNNGDFWWLNGNNLWCFSWWFFGGKLDDIIDIMANLGLQQVSDQPVRSIMFSTFTYPPSKKQETSCISVPWNSQLVISAISKLSPSLATLHKKGTTYTLETRFETVKPLNLFQLHPDHAFTTFQLCEPGNVPMFGHLAGRTTKHLGNWIPSSTWLSNGRWFPMLGKHLLVSHTITTGWWYTYPSEKYEFVSWDYLYIPNIWKNTKCSKPPIS